jgi:hypothetical protein
MGMQVSTRVWAAIGLLVAASVMGQDEALTRQEQLRIVRDYLFVTHRTPSASLQQMVAGVPVDSTLPIKCGMSAAADFVMNRHKLDKDLQAALASVDSLQARPILAETYNSPSGHFKIHYAVSGDDAVYQASTDVSPANGVPDYVDGVARIADSVWTHEVGDLGYPAPPADSFYTEGGDYRYDVYLLNLAASFYGLSYMDSLSIDGPGSIRATSFMQLDNDYQSLDAYKSRPLDAVRVTMAHEFFHAIQFGMDFTEADDYNRSFPRRYWMEMSATWMEDEMYDGINDYYGYLKYFFDVPTVSIQQFKGFTDLHPYGSAVFPIFLSEQYGKELIRDIWERCAAMGMGPQFWIAVEQALDSTTSHAVNLPIAFRQFALWNYYTGSRASMAPDTVGYSERASYPAIPDGAMAYHDTLPVLVTVQTNAFKPQFTAATYIKIDRLDQVAKRYYACGVIDTSNLCVVRFADTASADSTEIDRFSIPLSCRAVDTTCTLASACTDTTVVMVDSVFTPIFFLDSLIQPWGVSLAYSPLQNPDSQVVETGLLSAPFGQTFGFTVERPRLFQSVVFIFSDASYLDIYRYVADRTQRIAYIIDEKSDSLLDIVPREPSLLDAYPNPAVVAQLGTEPLRFRFQLGTNRKGYLTCALDENLMVVDLFDISGQFVGTIEQLADNPASNTDDATVHVISWDMKNGRGKDVVSGVYLAIGRLYCGTNRDELLAEGKTKVVVIR